MKLAAERAARRLAPGEAAARLEALKAPAALPAQPELKPKARLEAAAAERAAGVTAFKAGDHAQAVGRFEAGVALFTPMPADYPAEGSDAAAASEVRLGYTYLLRLYLLRLYLLRLYLLQVQLGCSLHLATYYLLLTTYCLLRITYLPHTRRSSAACSTSPPANCASSSR